MVTRPKLHRWQVTCSDGTTFEAQVAAARDGHRHPIQRALVLVLSDFRADTGDIVKIERLEEVRS